MTSYRFWNWDVLDSKAAIDVSMEYLDEEAEQHDRYVNIDNFQPEYPELFEDVVDDREVQRVDQYFFDDAELEVVEIPAGVYLLGDEEYTEEAEQILRSESPLRKKKSMERKGLFGLDELSLESIRNRIR